MNFKKIVTLLTISIFFFNCNSNADSDTKSKSNSSSNSEDESTIKKKYAYPAAFTQNFMNSCVNKGGDQSMCSCVLEKIQTQYTYEEISIIDSKAQANKTPAEFISFMGKARAACSIQ
jgi:hypothetical protein